ncbi:MAG TPA: HAMP domain-containing sensor histidine kinase [Gemmatimonadaceae bacterium]|nr:HAMP domain-containing sensor histidine kinase [Gemmatimonadaceae bacterium]
MTELDKNSAWDLHLNALENQSLEAMRLINELRVRDSLKTQFLSNISHDLRTPLTAIVTHAEILRDGMLGEVNDQQRKSIDGIITGGRQVLNMVNEILTYAKGSANQLDLVISEFALDDLIDQQRILNTSLLARKDIEFSTAVEDSVPLLRADRQKIAHILGNLLGNAIAFTSPGGRIWVTGRMAKHEGSAELVIEIGDTGVGIAPEHHELIFREFAQVDASPSRAHHGTGLGLPIARQLVEVHGGRIWLESAPGNGSRFFFSLPSSYLAL